MCVVHIKCICDQEILYDNDKMKCVCVYRFDIFPSFHIRSHQLWSHNNVDYTTSDEVRCFTSCVLSSNNIHGVNMDL